jgi:hypothetical protein
MERVRKMERVREMEVLRKVCSTALTYQPAWAPF